MVTNENNQSRHKPTGKCINVQLKYLDCIIPFTVIVHIDLTKLPDSSSKHTDFWQKDLGLSSSDKHSISEGQWLSDNVIRATQLLILKKYPDTKGLQSPVLGQTLTFDIHQKGVKFVQVLNISNCHWITVTSIGCSDSSEVLVYDSLTSGDISFQTKQQIAALIYSNKSKVKVIIPRVQQQSNGSNCGLFALAFAYSLSAGQDPSTVIYKEKQLRSHLLTCLESQQVISFPCHPRRRQTKTPIVLEFSIHCICRLPEEGKMIECERCLEWFHKDCVNTVPSHWRAKRRTKWVCEKCQSTLV